MTRSFAIIAFSLACALCSSEVVCAAPIQVEKEAPRATPSVMPSASSTQYDAKGPDRTERVASLRKDIEEFTAHCDTLKKKQPSSYEGKCSRLKKPKQAKPQ